MATDKPEPVNYWLSNLPATTPILELVRLGKLRWRIEQDDRELKGALGLDHFEGRGWAGWHHHVTLVAAAHGFLTLERLRRPNRWRRPAPWELLGELQVLLACWAGACPSATVWFHAGYPGEENHALQPDRALLVLQP